MMGFDATKGRLVSSSLVVLGLLALSQVRMDSTIPSYRDHPGVLSTTSSLSKDARPTGLRLVLIGDSITRHQYLSFAYFLRYGKWFDPKQVPHLVRQRDFLLGETFENGTQGDYVGWGNFFEETNRILSPMEKCDCYRIRWDSLEEVDTTVVENRYFYDPERNNTLTYIQAFGNVNATLHGRVLPEDAFRDISSTKYEHVNSSAVWRYEDWGTAIEEYVSLLNVTHLVMNAGMWPNDFSENKKARDSIARALRKTGIVGIWKTNAYRVGRHDKQERWMLPQAASADKAMTRLFGHNVLDVSWTYRVDYHYFWDKKHFLEPVYRIMNEDLLEMIGHHFPSNYKRQDIEELLVWNETKTKDKKKKVKNGER